MMTKVGQEEEEGAQWLEVGFVPSILFKWPEVANSIAMKGMLRQTRHLICSGGQARIGIPNDHDGKKER